MDEYGHDESTLAPLVEGKVLRLPSGRLAVPMIQLIEIAQKDKRMGRS